MLQLSMSPIFVHQKRLWYRSPSLPAYSANPLSRCVFFAETERLSRLVQQENSFPFSARLFYIGKIDVHVGMDAVPHYQRFVYV